MKSGRIGKTALLAAALTLTASLSVGSALAYFTSYCTAEGAVAMNMGFTETEIHETVRDGKHIIIENTGDYDCFVRVKVFAPNDIEFWSETKEGWMKHEDDQYWYYNSVLAPKEKTPELLIKYRQTDGSNPDEFNIIVVYETTPVLYDENGNPYADWDNVVVVDESAGIVTEPGAGEAADTEQEGE